MSGIIRTYEEEHNIFRPLIQMLNDFRGPGSPYPIPEIIYRSQMSETGHLPGENFYPRFIIMIMLGRHRDVMRSQWPPPRFAKNFQCPYYDNGRLRIHEFSTTMPLYADVITLIFLYLFYTKHNVFPPQMFVLAMMMCWKYMIFEPADYDETKEEDPTEITFRRVHYSFQSVALWMYNYVPEHTAFVRSVFPESNFPAMVGASYFPLILKKIRPKSTFMFLLHVNLALRVDCQPLSLAVRNQRRCTSLHVYTPDIRLDICTKLGIVINRNGVYDYAPTFYRRLRYWLIARTKIMKPANIEYGIGTLHINLLFPQI